MIPQSELATGSWLSMGVIMLVIAGFLIYVFIGCEQINEPVGLTTFEDPAIDELAAEFSKDLDLSESESEQLQRAFTNHRSGRHRPGYLWLVAGELQEKFTEEHMQRVYALINRYEAHLAENGKFVFFEGWPALTGQTRAGSINCMPDLTEEQLEKMKEIRQAYAQRLEHLKRKYRAGEISEEEYGRSLQALMAALQAEIFDLLTDEQKERWRKCLAMVQDIVEHHTSEAFQVMVRVLQLRREQRDELVAVQVRLRKAYHDLIHKFRAGEIDRDEFMDGLWELRNKREWKLAQIFNQHQYEIVKIHQALVLRMALNQFRNVRQGG